MILDKINKGIKTLDSNDLLNINDINIVNKLEYIYNNNVLSMEYINNITDDELYIMNCILNDTYKNVNIKNLIHGEKLKDLSVIATNRKANKKDLF